MKSYSSNFLNLCQALLVNMHYTRRKAGEYINIYKKRNLIKSIKLSPKEKKAIDNLWKQYYGKKIPYCWHKLYASYTGMVDINYFPEILYSTNLEKRYNDFTTALIYEDKSQLDVVLKDYTTNESHTVPSILYSTGGLFYNTKHEFISKAEAISLISNSGKCVIKPSMDSDSGRGVRVLDLKNGIDVKQNEGLQEIFKSYGTNFLVQNFIRTHESLKSLNPSSVNTIRIITYISEGKVYHCPLAMRIGASDAEVDNIHAGGFCIGIKDNGYLNENAFTEYGEKHSVHPKTGMVFGNHCIPSITDAIKLVETKHQLIPRLTFISWDVTIDEDGKPLIVEMNTRNQSAWFPQMVNGLSLFGENTPKMIKMLK